MDDDQNQLDNESNAANDSGDSHAEPNANEDNLPSDPTLLTEALREERKTLAQIRIENRNLKKEVSRQKERVQELDTSKTHWSREAQRLQDELTNRPSGVQNGNGDKKSSSNGNGSDQNQIDAALNALELKDLADYATDEKNGMRNLVKDLLSTGLFLTPAKAQEIGQEMLRQERERTLKYGHLTEEYPDLADPKSELNQLAREEFELIMKANPNSNGETAFELAAARAERKLQRDGRATTPSKRTSSRSDDDRDEYEDEPESNRLKRAQSNPGTRSRSTGVPQVDLTAADKKALQQIGGGLLTEKDLMEAKQSAVINQRNAQKRRGSYASR